MNSLGRKCYKAAATHIATAKETKSYTITSLALQMRKEMTEICSVKHNSMLRDSHRSIKNFCWESIYFEFNQKVPTLLSLLKGILPKSNDKFLSFMIALLLKKKCKHMSLVQHVISVLLYGNATSKEVCKRHVKIICLFIYMIVFLTCSGLQLSTTIHGVHVTISYFRYN